MASSSSGGPTDEPSFDSGDWEVVNYAGLVCKRLRRFDLSPSRPSVPADAESDDIRRHGISRKKKSLLLLKERYSRELHQWESLFSSFSSPSAASTADVGPSSSSAASPFRIPAPSRQPVVDELLLQAKAQEADVTLLSDMCEYVETVCDAAEERLAKKLIALPIWGSPQELMSCLQYQRR